MAAAIPDPPTRPHPSSVERRSRGKWLQTRNCSPRRKSPRAKWLARRASQTRALSVTIYGLAPVPMNCRFSLYSRFVARETRGDGAGRCMVTGSHASRGHLAVTHRRISGGHISVLSAHATTCIRPRHPLSIPTRGFVLRTSTSQAKPATRSTVGGGRHRVSIGRHDKLGQARTQRGARRLSWHHQDGGSAAHSWSWTACPADK